MAYTHDQFHILKWESIKRGCDGRSGPVGWYRPLSFLSHIISGNAAVRFLRTRTVLQLKCTYFLLTWKVTPIKTDRHCHKNISYRFHYYVTVGISLLQLMFLLDIFLKTVLIYYPQYMHVCISPVGPRGW